LKRKVRDLKGEISFDSTVRLNIKNEGIGNRVRSTVSDAGEKIIITDLGEKCQE